MNTNSMTVIIPAHNDAEGLAKVLDALVPAAEKRGWRVTVVNDASVDNTAELLAGYGDRIVCITNDSNLGYGASIKRGILHAETKWVATMDADNQHRLSDLEYMHGLLDENTDALLGDRDQRSAAPLSRQPGKWVLRHAANFLAAARIPDINCGLRIFRRGIILDLFNITSDHFSFSTSSTIALLQLNCRVRFVSVTVDPRIGKSAVRQVRDGLYTLLLILRLIFLFHPLRVMLPMGCALMALGALSFLATLVWGELAVSKSTLLLFLSGLNIFFFALIADQNSSLRRDFLLNKIRMDQYRSSEKNET
jgi:glycosyltransferase involved in cell wall biosynthesis